MSSIFTKIINGELPCHKVMEDDFSMSIMTIAPITPGHVIVYPKIEVDHLPDIPTDIYLKVMEHAQIISKAIHKASGKKRVTMAIQGFEVPHFHVHLIPADGPSEFDFKLAKKASDQDLAAICAKIRDCL